MKTFVKLFAMFAFAGLTLAACEAIDESTDDDNRTEQGGDNGNTDDNLGGSGQQTPDTGDQYPNDNDGDDDDNNGNEGDDEGDDNGDNDSEGDEGDDGDEDYDPSDYTTLTSDVTVSFDYAEACFYGDYYEIGVNDWELYFETEDGSQYLQVEFFTELSQSDDFVGTYEFECNYEAGTALPGDYVEGDDGYYYLVSTWYLEFTGDNMSGYAAALYGEMTITKSGDEYTVEVVFADDLDNVVTGTYTGEIAIYEGEVDSTAALNIRKNGIRTVAAKKIASRGEGRGVLAPALRAKKCI